MADTPERISGPFDDGQRDLLSGDHAELPGDGQRDCLM
jgi:hypothetical protein